MNSEDKALKWLIKSGIATKQTIRKNIIGNPDFETKDGQGFEVKTCQRGKFFKHLRHEPGGILFSSMKQWLELTQHANCKILVFGEGKEPIAIIPMSELPVGAEMWHDFTLRVMKKKTHTHPKIVERAIKKEKARQNASLARAYQIAAENQNANDSLHD